MSHLQVDYFLSKAKFPISNVIVIVSYQISYDIKILTMIPLYSSIKIRLVEVNYEGWNFNSGNYLFTTDTK